MRYPKFLPKNGRIGLVAPSFGWTCEPYISRGKAAIERFEKVGYKCVLGPNVYADCGVGKSNTAEACGAELTDFMTNESCDIVLSVGGGETMGEDLNFVDFEAIKKAEPKWYMGYSDNTHFTFPLTALCDVASIYGPNAASFGMRELHPSLKDALGVLDGSRVENVAGSVQASAGKESDATGSAQASAGKESDATEIGVIRLQNYDGWEGEAASNIEESVSTPTNVDDFQKNESDEASVCESDSSVELAQATDEIGLPKAPLVSPEEPEDPLKSYDINMPFELKIFAPDKESLDTSMTDSQSVSSRAGLQTVSSTTDSQSISTAVETQPISSRSDSQSFSTKVGSQSVSFSGRLIGGCLDCLINLSGTRFDGAASFAERYKEDGIIWFMESCDLSPLDVRRGLWHLKNTGWFKYVRGFIFGRPCRYGEEMFGLTHYDAITSMLSEFGVPIVMDADIGHLPPAMPLISGALAEVRAEKKSAGDSLEIKMKLV